MNTSKIRKNTQMKDIQKKVERIILKQNGKPDVLQNEVIELIPNKNNGLLIEVWAIGIGFADIMAQRGGYALAPKLPFSPGYDFVGKIIDPYNSVSFNKGDMVCAMLPTMGTYRDIIEVKEDFLIKLPKGISIIKTAAAILNYLTAYCILEEKVKVKEGNTVFIQGASGGVGIALAQIGKLKKLNMFGTASKSKHRFLKEMGVIPIDYRNEDFVKIIKNKYPKGINAVFDARGGIDLRNASKVVKKGGTVVTYGFSGNGFGGNKEMIKGLWELMKLMIIPNGKRIKICGTPNEIKKKSIWYKKKLTEIVDLINNGSLNPLIDSIFPLKEAGLAHAKFEEGNLKGKIILITKYYVDKKLEKKN